MITNTHKTAGNTRLGLIKSPGQQVSEPLSAETERLQHEANFSPPLITLFDPREQCGSFGAGRILDASNHYWAEDSRFVCLRVNPVIFCCVVSG
jgi:hypothetical protein